MILLACLDTSKFSEYRDSVIMQTLLDTGMRCGEYLAVTEDDLNNLYQKYSPMENIGM